MHMHDAVVEREETLGMMRQARQELVEGKGRPADTVFEDILEALTAKLRQPSDDL